ncbi:MAG: hypothetical protein ACKVP5_13965 [Aestuariivirga sp.]
MLEALRHPPRWVEWLIKLALVIGAIWLAINLIWPTCTFRYRLTVEVETPQGLKTGSSVIDATIAYQWQALPEVGVFKSSVTGEAVFVDLGDGKNLVVTLTNDGSGRTDAREPEKRSHDAFYLPFVLFGLDYLDKSTLCGAIRAVNDARQVPLEMLPTIVTFLDANDPKSVRRLEPRGLPAILGQGYSIRAATLLRVTDPPSDSIEQELGWLKGASGVLWGPNYQPDHPERYLSFSNFKSRGWSQ